MAPVLCPFCAHDAAAAACGEGEVLLLACRNCLNPFLLTSEGGEFRSRPIEGAPAVEDLVLPGSVMGNVLGSLERALTSLPVLPQVPQRIMAMIYDPLLSMSELAEVINEDPAIAVKVLRVANSSFYATTKEIKEVSAACARLGIKAVANLVMAISSRDLYRTKNQQFLTLMQQMWQQALATAHCAQSIAGMGTPRCDPDAAFLAGLTHLIGKLVLFDLITTKYQGNVGRLKESPELLSRVLEQFYALVGLHVVLRWQLPPELCFTTYCHTKPEITPVEKWAPLTHVVSLARACSDAAGFGREPAGDAPSPCTHPSAVYLKIPEDRLTPVYAELQDRLDPLLQTMSRL